MPLESSKGPLNSLHTDLAKRVNSPNEDISGPERTAAPLSGQINSETMH